MKTQTVTTYTAAELQEQHPDTFARALAKWNRKKDFADWSYEIIDSLKACISSANLKLRAWSLGAYNRGNFITVEFRQYDAEGLRGGRAMAWLENNLFAQLRTPWTGKERAGLRRYGSGYYAGKVKPGPLTGYYADEVYLGALYKAVRDGDTLKEAFEGLENVCAKLLEEECKVQSTPEYFIDHAEVNEMQFTEDGEEF